MSSDPYQSIKAKIKLPQKYKIRTHHQPFDLLNSQDDSILYDELLLKTNSLVEELNSVFQNYQNPAQFRFDFPKSLFPDIPDGQTNQIIYEQKVINEQEDTFKNKLSQEQLQDIAQKGQFKVRSNHQYVTLPYVWKINETLFWGKQKVEIVWKNSLAKIYGMFVQAKNIFFKYTPLEMARVMSIPSKLFSIMFGKKSLQVTVSVDYQKEVFKEFWNKIMNNYYKQSQQWGSALWNYLYVYYNPQLQKPRQYGDEKQQADERQYQLLLSQSQRKKNLISQVNNEFNKQWNKMKKKVINQISQNFTSPNQSFDNKTEIQEQLLVNKESNDNKILQALGEKKFTLYTDYMRQQLPKKNIPLDVVNAILIIVRLFKVINTKYESKRVILQQKRKDLQESIKIAYPIKYRYQPFFNELFTQQFKTVTHTVNQQMYQSISSDQQLQALLSQSQKGAIREFIKLRANYEAFQSAKKNQLPELHSPIKTFYFSYPLFPPYEIQKRDDRYFLKMFSDEIKVSTKDNGWKLKLYWIRFKTWLIKSFITLLFFAWNGPTGIRCLYGIDNFKYDMSINMQSGEIFYEQRKTVIGTFLSVMEGMKKSRKQFEELPDLGLLGKNVSRLCNYLQCYILRFVFVGIIFVLIGYPCLIIVLSLLSIVLALTTLVWIPLALLATYFFNIFIYQVDSDVMPDSCLARLFPIFSLSYYIIRPLIVFIVLSFNIILFVPFKSLFVFLFCLLQRGFRAIFDRFMVFLFKHLGRTPSRDTSIARKISGPGMSKQFYMSINEEDVYVLICSQLQQIYMRKFNQITEEQINSNNTKATKILQAVFKPFKLSSNGLQEISENTNKLMQSYQSQHKSYMARYPQNPSMVKFTQQEIERYFQNTVNIVKNFVTKNQIQKWIFDEYVIYEGMYDQLARSIWIEVFNMGEQIFEPLQQLDARFKLQDQYSNEDGFNYSMKKSVGFIMQSLEGEVSLHHRTTHVSPFKHNLLQQQSQVDFLSSIWEYLSKNSGKSVWVNLEEFQSIFVPNLNIKQICIIDKQKRQMQIKCIKDIIDL